MALNGFDPFSVPAPGHQDPLPGSFEPFPQPAPFPTLAGPEDIGCNGICLTPADIGLPEYSGPGVVAYAHPDCPEHGDRLDNEEDTTYAAFPVDDSQDI